MSEEIGDLLEALRRRNERLSQIDAAIAVFSEPSDIPEGLRLERIEIDQSIGVLKEALAAASEQDRLTSPTGQEHGDVFAMAPFKEPFDTYYREIIEPAITELGSTIVRSDQIYSPSAFIQTIWECILASHVAIAEMTGMNPNVLYELGLAHAINKPVVMITQQIADIPADLRHINCIVYETASPNWAQDLRAKLQRMVLYCSGDAEFSYVKPGASIANTNYIERLLAENKQLRSQGTGLSLVVAEQTDAIAGLAARGRELENANAALMQTDSEDVATYDDDGTTIHLYPLRNTGFTIELVEVGAGAFIYGPESGQETVLDTFYASRFAITNAQYCAFLNDAGNRIEDGASWIKLDGKSPGDACRISQESATYRVQDGYEDHPVTYVNYYGASAFCEWAGGQLPSEQQWEKAVRGTDGRTYPWGNAPPDATVANYEEGGWLRDVPPIAVYEKRAGVSPFGVVQGIGNVWHWTSTYFPERQVQAVRGGSFLDFRVGHRTVHRFLVSPDGPDFSQGLLFMCRFLG